MIYLFYFVIVLSFINVDGFWFVHEIGIVLFLNILLNIWHNAFVNFRPPYFMNSFCLVLYFCYF